MLHWKRAIILVDMNAFFASVEQLDHPEWRGRPVAVTNGRQGGCIITCSYEARAFGIKTGMHLAHARRLAPDLVHAPSRPDRYIFVSELIMQALQVVTPDIEIFSIDEAFLDVTACQRLHGGPVSCAHLVKQAVFNASGLHCSVGLSSDKTSAKYAAKLQKPDGLQIIYPDQVKERLANVPVTQLCGIAKGIASFLARYHAYTCADVAALPMSVLARRFGNQGRRLWFMCAGQDPEPVRVRRQDAKSMGHSKVLPPDTQHRAAILKYMLHMCEKLAARLRVNGMWAQTFEMSYRQREAWVSHRYRLLQATQDQRPLYECALQFITTFWQGEGVFQVQITALDPEQGVRQTDLSFEDKTKSGVETRGRVEAREQTVLVQDEIQQRFGEQALGPARLLNHSHGISVISPTWRPQKGGKL